MTFRCITIHSLLLYALPLSFILLCLSLRSMQAVNGCIDFIRKSTVSGPNIKYRFANCLRIAGILPQIKDLGFPEIHLQFPCLIFPYTVVDAYKFNLQPLSIYGPIEGKSII